MEDYPVSRMVNSPANDSVDLLEPVSLPQSVATAASAGPNPL